MALPVNIKELIEQRVVESTRIEYKSDWNPVAVLHSICAFANDIDNCGGGYIILGIEERNGRPLLPVKGLQKEDIDRINKDILNKCNLIEPRYLPSVEPIVYEGKDIVVIWIPGGEDRPYKCPVHFPSDKSRDWEKAYYIRKMANTIRANAKEERELVLMTHRIPFDDRLNQFAEITDLKTSLICEFLHAVKSELYSEALEKPLLDVAKDMHLVGGTTEFCKPLNVGLMFFNGAPENFFRYAQIEVVDKPEPTGERMVEKYFRGPLDKQLRDALAYIKNYMLKMQITKVDGQAEAIHTWNIPFKAIEEALSNAVYHKSYEIPEPITVTLTPEKMEILSLPGPDLSISDEDLRKCHLVSRQNRNRRIGDFLKELDLVEGRNTGIPAILRAMRQNGSKPPIFETDAERSYFLVTLPVHADFIPKQSNDVQSSGGATSKATHPRKRRSYDETKKLVIKALKSKGDLSIAEIASVVGYAQITTTLKNIVKELIAEGKAVKTTPDKPHSRNQKIHLK
jgi:ATP-dependent DNA helicase RecG